MSETETSLVFIKPCAAMQPAVAARILEDLFSDKSLRLVGFKRLRVTEQLARLHYAEHEKKPFFSKLLAQLTSGPVIAMIFHGPDAISKIRALAGATMVEKAAPNSIRGKYGLLKGLNVLHASDAPASGKREVELWKQAVGLVEDAPNALKEANAFIKRWKTKGDNTSRDIRALCTSPLDSARREAIRDIYITVNKGTDVTKAEIDRIINVIDQTLRE